MQAEIIAIGDELLIGQTIDTNSTFIAAQLSLMGISVKQKRTIADEATAIKEALDAILPGTDLVFLTGGLGPTNDDITKDCLNDYFGGKLEFHEEVYRNIEEIFSSFDRSPQEVHRQQAFLPDVCRPLTNAVGTAPGMHFQKDGRHYFSLPGVPYETEHLVKDQIMPWISENLQAGTAVHRTLLTQGIPESILAERLKEVEESLVPDVSLAYLPSPGMVRLRLSSYTGDPGEAARKVEGELTKVRQVLGDRIFGEGAQSLGEVVGSLLKEQGLSLSTAESCTGGSIASMITTIPGSSDYFKGSVVSYATEAKHQLLGVNKQVIEEKGVVSREVVEEMARGAQAKFHSDFALATTGIAGPGGGSVENPVGTVWIAVAEPRGVRSKLFRFGKDRGRNIHIASLTALEMLRRVIQKIESP